MKELLEVLEAAHRDVASMHYAMQESQQYDDWESGQAALKAHSAVEDVVEPVIKLPRAIRLATDALDFIIDNSDGEVLDHATHAQEALNRIWNFRDPDAEAVSPQAA